MSGVLSKSTNTSSVIDCFKFETYSSGLSQTIPDITSEPISTLEMPSIDPYDGPVPSRLVGFNEAKSEKEHYGTVHFYLDDSRFECIWNNPPKYVPLLRQYESVIGPDFSQYVDMTYDERLFNNYRNYSTTVFLQRNGIPVIPNISWSTPNLYDHNFCWIPKHSIIAIGSMGVLQHNVSRYLFSEGYKEVLRRLEPHLIVRYGPKLDCEDESISIYFPNARLERLRQLPRKKNQMKTVVNLMSNQLKLF